MGNFMTSLPLVAKMATDDYVGFGFFGLDFTNTHIRLLDIDTGIGLEPVVEEPDQADSGIDVITALQDIIRELRTVAVSDGVGSPDFGKLQGQLLVAGLAG